jgi:hypothetical protein
MEETLRGPRIFDSHSYHAVALRAQDTPNKAVPAAADGDGTIFVAIPSYRGKLNTSSV